MNAFASGFLLALGSTLGGFLYVALRDLIAHRYVVHRWCERTLARAYWAIVHVHTAQQTVPSGWTYGRYDVYDGRPCWRKDMTGLTVFYKPGRGYKERDLPAKHYVPTLGAACFDAEVLR